MSRDKGQYKMRGNWRFSNSRSFVQRRGAGGRAPGLPGRAFAPRALKRIINRASQGPGQRRPFTARLLPPGTLLFLKTAASWAAEKRRLCGSSSGPPAARERGSSVSALRAGGIRAARSPGWAGGPGSFLKAARLLRKPRDFHGALEKSAMEMVMGGIETAS